MLALLSTLLVTTPDLLAAEYRKLELSDGRIVRGEVLESTDTGLRLKLQQGVTFIDFQDVQKIEDIDAASWRAQSPWRGAVPPFQVDDEANIEVAREAVRLVGDALNGFPNISTVRPGLGLDSAAAEAIVACNGEPSCVLEPARTGGLDVVILGTLSAGAEGGDTLTVTAVYTASDRARAHPGRAAPDPSRPPRCESRRLREYRGSARAAPASR